MIMISWSCQSQAREQRNLTLPRKVKAKALSWIQVKQIANSKKVITIIVFMV